MPECIWTKEVSRLVANSMVFEEFFRDDYFLRDDDCDHIFRIRLTDCFERVLLKRKYTVCDDTQPLGDCALCSLKQGRKEDSALAGEDSRA